MFPRAIYGDTHATIHSASCQLESRRANDNVAGLVSRARAVTLSKQIPRPRASQPRFLQVFIVCAK